jgi:hypothetical protein
MKSRLLVTALGVFVFVSQAWALNQLVNYDFQLPGDVTGFNGDWGQPDVPGWAADGPSVNSGILMPSNYGMRGKSSGDFTAFLMGTDPAAWNLTSNIIAAHTSYTVTLEAVHLDFGFIPSNLKVKMYYNNEGVRSEIVSQIWVCSSNCVNGLNSSLHTVCSCTLCLSL